MEGQQSGARGQPAVHTAIRPGAIASPFLGRPSLRFNRYCCALSTNATHARTMERASSWHAVDAKQQPPMLFALSDPSVAGMGATSMSAQDTLSSARSSGWIARDPQDLLRASAGISAPYAWADDNSPFSSTTQDDYIYGARPMGNINQSYAVRSSAMSSLGGPTDAYGMGMMMMSHGMMAGHGPMGNPMAVSASACRSHRAREIAIGRWTSEEHRWFLKGLEMFQGPAWGEIARLIGSRTSTQVRTHAQKFFTKLARQNQTLPHFEAQIRKERERLMAQGIAIANSTSSQTSTPTAMRAPPSLLSRTSLSGDVGDGIGAYNYTQSVTPTATNAMFNLHSAGNNANSFALASLSPTATKLSTLTKKRSHRDMLAMAMHDSISPSSSSSSLDGGAFSGLGDYNSQQPQQHNYSSMVGSSNKPRLNVDTSAASVSSITGYPQQPSPLSWCGPLPSPIQHPQHQQQENVALDESLPSMTNLLRRRSVTAVSPPSVAN